MQEIGLSGPRFNWKLNLIPQDAVQRAHHNLFFVLQENKFRRILQLFKTIKQSKDIAAKTSPLACCALYINHNFHDGYMPFISVEINVLLRYTCLMEARVKIAVSGNLKKHRITVITAFTIAALGAALIILPILLDAFPDLAEMDIGTIMGWVSLAAGITQVVYSQLTKDKKTFLTGLMQAMFFISTGIYLLIFNPRINLPIVFIITMFLLLSSLSRIMYASKIYPQKGTGWVVVFCISDIVMSLMIAVNFPSGANWARGLILGICILQHGLTIKLVSTSQKQQNLSESLQTS